MARRQFIRLGAGPKNAANSVPQSGLASEGSVAKQRRDVVITIAKADLNAM